METMHSDTRPVEITRKRFTADEYFRMGETGILGPEERTELIEGEIIKMSPINPPHAGCVNRANELLVSALKGDAVVGIQNPAVLNIRNVPQPDVLVLKFREDFYGGQHPAPEDVLLMIEVSDTTLRFDQKVKLPLYAAAAIPEVWIEDVNKKALLVHRDPDVSRRLYRSTLTLGRGDSVSPMAFSDLGLRIEDLLG